MSDSRNKGNESDDDWGDEAELSQKGKTKLSLGEEEEEEDDWDLDEDNAPPKQSLKGLLDDNSDDEEEKEEITKQTVVIYNGVASTFSNPNMAKRSHMDPQNRSQVQIMGPQSLLIAAYSTGEQRHIDNAVEILTKLTNQGVQGMELSEDTYQKTFDLICRTFTNQKEGKDGVLRFTFDKSTSNLDPAAVISLAEKTRNPENVATAIKFLQQFGYENLGTKKDKVPMTIHDPSKGTEDSPQKIAAAAQTYGQTMEKQAQLSLQRMSSRHGIKGGGQ
jgi:hypothetical protein